MQEDKDNAHIEEAVQKVVNIFKGHKDKDFEVDKAIKGLHGVNIFVLHVMNVKDKVLVQGNDFQEKVHEKRN